jgi:hypothetical protein
MKKYLNSIKGVLMEFQRTQYYDLTYTKRKERGYRVNRKNKNIGIEYYKDFIIVHESEE